MVAFNKFIRLHEHAAGTAARVVDDSLVRLDELGDELNDAGGRVELAVLLRTADGKRLQEVLIHAPNKVFLVITLLADLGDLVYERLNGALGCAKRGEQAQRQSALERGICLFRLAHGIVDDGGNRVVACVIDKVGPPCRFGQIEYVDRVVERRLLKERRDVTVLFDELLATIIKLVAGELQEYEADDGVAVLLHAADAAKRHTAVPQHLLELKLGIVLLGTFACHKAPKG